MRREEIRCEPTGASGLLPDCCTSCAEWFKSFAHNYCCDSPQNDSCLLFHSIEAVLSINLSNGVLPERKSLIL